MAKLILSNLIVSIESKKIINSISLTIASGEIHALMGPNGSGKSTLAYALMGHPHYQVEGKISINKSEIQAMSPDERARKGIFLAFQNPLAIPGVPVANFIRLAHESVYGKTASVMEFNNLLITEAATLGLDRSFLRRSLNDGFSGGERKKTEMLQAIMFKPKFAIFDEIDTGLDVDALKYVSQGIKTLAKNGTGVLIITHYQRILHLVKPNYVHVLKNGEIIKSGNDELAKQIEDQGYSSL